jgi:Ca2+-binding EF-hand superfamily protein
VDFDKSGQITYHEFLAATFSKKKLTESNLRSAFEMISNHNEYFTSSDLAHITGRDVSAEQVDLMIQDAHMNVDKKFDFEDVSMSNIHCVYVGIYMKFFFARTHTFTYT